MKNLKIFPKMFIQIFFVLGALLILSHLLLYIIFPKTYLESRKEELAEKADLISENLSGRDRASVEEALKLFSETSEIKAVLVEESESGAIKVQDDIDINLESSDNSLLIEERQIELSKGEGSSLQFLSVADMKKEGKDLSLKFLPYSLSISIIFSALVALIYARQIKNNVTEIKDITDKMMVLDKTARLKITSADEISQLKEQINGLYFTLLETIDDMEEKNAEIIRLEKVKADFFKGASHELKTPLASLKIILENMAYNIGKYKDRDYYINESLKLVDDLSENISQILTVSSLDKLKKDGEVLEIKGIVEEEINKYRLLAREKNLTIKNNLADEKIFIGRSALKIIVSNLLSNAVKYSKVCGTINIGVEGKDFYVANSFDDESSLDMEKLFQVKFDINKKNSSGLGLYIVGSLLNNYNIAYDANVSKGEFIFKINLEN